MGLIPLCDITLVTAHTGLPQGRVLRDGTSPFLSKAPLTGLIPLCDIINIRICAHGLSKRKSPGMIRRLAYPTLR